MPKTNRRDFLAASTLTLTGMAIPGCSTPPTAPVNAQPHGPVSITQQHGQTIPRKTHTVDFCVVGGGLSGMCAAIAAARQGIQVALIQDRPVLGGNASSEIRMWVCGAHGKNNRETGIVEELHLENLYRNTTPCYSIWDSVLYEKARFQENLKLFLNCSVFDAKTADGNVTTVTGWQTTTQTFQTIKASLFADCSGDSILAPLVGADYRVGREARSEFNEDIEPEKGDRKTMGMSCLIQVRETDGPQKFIPPTWAYTYKTDKDLPHRGHNHKHTNFWWIELGGEQDSIHDTEEIRDELLKVAFGVWDHIKNQGDHGAENWALDWMGFLPGKRESRRYVGDHILNQNDVRAKGQFKDLVAYGGWSMDDHHPGGMNYPGKPTIFHRAPSPFGIPYRCLYSKNIKNLFCAGRNISATHAAMSATRVMATCSVIGQAVGTAAAIATRHKLTPRGVYREKIGRLQQMLMDQDCYLPWRRRAIPALSQKARLIASAGNPASLLNGVDRPVGKEANNWTAPVGAWLQFTLRRDGPVKTLRLVFDSDLNRRTKNMPCNYPLHQSPFKVPETLVRSFTVMILRPNSNTWEQVHKTDNNYQRLVRIGLSGQAKAVKVIFDATWGARELSLFGCDIS